MMPIIFGESVIGASHLKHEKKKQDSFLIIDNTSKRRSKQYKKYYEELSESIQVVAVSDGHGSDSCPYSDVGANTAVNVFCDVMAFYSVKYNDNMEEFFHMLNREGESARLSQEIVNEWGKRIIEVHKLAQREFPIDSEGNRNLDAVKKQYGATLLGMLLSDKYAFVFQLGDGDIVSVDEKNVIATVEGDKILGVETHSISKRDSWKRVISKVEMISKKRPFMYCLSTDGFMNSHASEDEYKKTCKAYFDMMNTQGIDIVKDNLGNWLSETSEKGCGDDITAVFVYYPNAVSLTAKDGGEE